MTHARTTDSAPLASRRPSMAVYVQHLRVALAAVALLLLALATVAVLPSGGLALALVGFGLLFALPFAIVHAMAGSLDPAE